MNHDLVEKFSELTGLLQEFQQYWRPIAFYDPDPPWVAEHPQLAKELLALPIDRLERLAVDDQALAEFFSHLFPVTPRIKRSLKLAQLPEFYIPDVNPRFYSGMPGRKWQQVKSFARHLPPAGPILEWCAGKSHLGFYLYHGHHQPVTALEIDAVLVAQANARAALQEVPLRSYKVDVLSAAAQVHVRDASQVVALHACGSLHEHLLHLCVENATPHISLAPCCYHKRLEDSYVPLSQRGRESGIILNKQELHLAVMETATAGARVQRQRRALQMKRLGFDELQRELNASPKYLSLPPLQGKWADADFEAFCRHCADLKNLPLSATTDWNHYQMRGEQRFWRVSAFDLLRFLFRRPLELWLALDRAMLLIENDYSTRLGIFCPSQVTPRNLLLQAWRE